MIKVLIASHGRMASGMATTVRMFVGEEPKIETIDAYVDGPEDTYDDKIRQFLMAVGPEDGAYIFTDFYGGSVNQHVTTQLMAAKKENVRLVSNINVPTVIDILTSPGLLSYAEIQEMIEEDKAKLVCLEELSSGEETPEEDFLD